MTEILIGRNARASLSMGTRHGGRARATARVGRASNSQEILRDIPDMFGHMFGHAMRGLTSRMVGGRR